MAHTDRQPTDEVFNDIVNAAQNVWIFGQKYHKSYVKEQLDSIEATSNYADNWYSIIGRMDDINQTLFIHNVKLKATHEFLNKWAGHYRFVTLRELK